MTESGQPMPNVLICEVCEAERHLTCSGLTDPPEGDYVCPECSERKRPAKKAPRSDDLSARARQLSSRCLKCGADSERKMSFQLDVVAAMASTRCRVASTSSTRPHESLRVSRECTEALSRQHRCSTQGYFALCSQGNSAEVCLLYTSPSPRDKRQSRMPSSA